MLDLHHQALNQANIASGNTKNGGNGLLVGEIIGIRLYLMTPALIQEKVGLLLG